MNIQTHIYKFICIYLCTHNHTHIPPVGIQCFTHYVGLFSFLKKKTTLWPLFYGWDLTASRLQSHHEEAVYFLPLSSQKFLVLILSTSEG